MFFEQQRVMIAPQRPELQQQIIPEAVPGRSQYELLQILVFAFPQKIDHASAMFCKKWCSNWAICFVARRMQPHNTASLSAKSVHHLGCLTVTVLLDSDQHCTASRELQNVARYCKHTGICTAAHRYLHVT